MTNLRPVLLAVALLIAARCVSAASARSSPLIVGYIFPQHSTLTPGEVDPHRITRLNYAFANIQDGRMVAGFAEDAANLAFVTALRKQNPSLTVLISVGGWLWSGGFSDLALTRESRAQFIESAIAFIDQYHLDGLDVDWEYPGMAGATQSFRPEDKQNFTLLLKELRQRFNAYTRKTGRKLYLTIAAGGSSDFLAHTEMAQAVRYLDAVNLMSYDYYLPGSEPITGHHAALFTNPRDPEQESADASVKAFEKAGVPARKIVLGIPFYGHVWADVVNQEHGLFEPGKAAPNASAPFNVIESTMLNHGFTRYWDPVSRVPWLFNADTRTFVSYEDEQSIAGKCRYVLDHKLGGIMFWNLENDPEGKLLGAIDGCLK